MPSKPATPDYDELQLRDALADGSFNPVTGELRPGFPVMPEDVVLDVGCGEGRDTVFCARRGAHIIYADADPAQVFAAGERMAGAGARALVPLVSNAAPLPLPDGTASRVIASEVLEHVDDPAQFLAELVRVGQPGALYLITVPDPVAEELQRGLAPDIHFQKPNHIRVIGRDAFARMVTDAGLVIEKRGAYGFYRTIWWMFFWICGVELTAANHPMLESWASTWNTLLNTPGNREVRAALNELMPKSQYIVARKPGKSAGSNPGPGFSAIRHAAAALGRLVSRPRREAVPPAASFIPTDDIDPRVVGLHDSVQSGWFRMEQHEIFEGFPIVPEDVVVDVGCGDGNYSTLCGQWGAHVIFSDVDSSNVAITRQRLAATAARQATGIVGDADPLPLEDGIATKVICTEVLEHVDDPVRLLAELVRVGKSGALYLLSVPDAVQEGLQHKLAPPEFFVKPKPGAGPIRGLFGGHLRTIGREEFVKLATDAGLIVERHEFVGFFWSLWMAFFWICNVDFRSPRHSLLAHWARTWKHVLDAPDGHRVKTPFDNFMPKSQVIVARKP